MLHIIAGKWKGRSLILPPAPTTRPTSSRAREALFDVLTSTLWKAKRAWEDVAVLDAFAGSGALGLEALSRAAKQAFFFESDAKAFAILQKNIEKLEAQNSALPFLCNTLSPPKASTPVQILFMDGPYDQGLEEPALEALERQGWIEPQTHLVIESPSAKPPLSVKGFVLLDSRTYGRGRISQYEKDQDTWKVNF